MYRETTICGFGLDPATRLPVIILCDATSDRKAPLWLNSGDLVSIATDLIGRELSGGKESVDLVAAILGNLGLMPQRVFIDDQDDGGYHSTLLFSSPDGESVMPLAPPEAVLMALRYTLPVMVSSTLLERLMLPAGVSDRFPGGEREGYEENLEKLDPKEMGKFPM
jgi:bifunctional DNase/RNase